jgi:hypothetical protein
MDGCDVVSLNSKVHLTRTKFCNLAFRILTFPPRDQLIFRGSKLNGSLSHNENWSHGSIEFTIQIIEYNKQPATIVEIAQHTPITLASTDRSTMMTRETRKRLPVYGR